MFSLTAGQATALVTLLGGESFGPRERFDFAYRNFATGAVVVTFRSVVYRINRDGLVNRVTEAE